MVSTQVLATAIDAVDPAEGLPAVAALRLLLEEVESSHVAHARALGWSWAAIGAALGVSRQSVHKKYARGARR